MPTARPFTQEMAASICEAISVSPYGLARICREHPEFPAQSTIMKWLTEEHDGFVEQYARACARRADLLFDECLDIADDSVADGERGDNGKETQHATEQVARSKLRVDTRKWMAGKLAPKKYGDKLELGADGSFVAAFAALKSISAGDESDGA